MALLALYIGVVVVNAPQGYGAWYPNFIGSEPPETFLPMPWEYEFAVSVFFAFLLGVVS